MNQRWGELANRMGTVVEDLVSVASCRSCRLSRRSADRKKYLTRHRIYALAMGDEAMQVLNLEAVRSRQTAP
jgi:hypothetical protein